MSDPKYRVTRGFKALPERPQGTVHERRMIAFFNAQFEEVIDRISEIVNLRTAPGETKQRIATVKNDLRSAAQNGMAAIEFNEMSKTSKPSTGDTPNATERSKPD